jgi:hypothetical protein
MHIGAAGVTNLLVFLTQPCGYVDVCDRHHQSCDFGVGHISAGMERRIECKYVYLLIVLGRRHLGEQMYLCSSVVQLTT